MSKNADEFYIKMMADEMAKQAVDRGIVDYFAIGAEPSQFFAHYLTRAYNLALEHTEAK